MNARMATALWVSLALGAARIYAQESPPAEHQHHQMPMPDMPAQDSKQGINASEAEHVAPEPPKHSMGPMPYQAMAQMMQMDDRERYGKVLIDQLEWRDASEGSASVWDAEAWYGGDYNKLRFRTEGDRAQGQMEDARAEVFWDRLINRWWSLQAGARQDFGEGPSRTWAAVGVEGLAPYRFEIEATLYAGEQGRTAARLKAEYELLLTQRLVLQPEAEANLYGKSDRERGLGSGLSDIEAALRLRYEIRREFAPYVGLVWSRRFGDTATQARVSGRDADDLQIAAGFRIWF